MEILVFGDSIAYGAWDREGGWVARLRRMLDVQLIDTEDEKYYHTIYNLGILSEDTAGTLSRFDSETAQRFRKDEERMIIFALGTNDSKWMIERDTNCVALADYEKNLRELVARARRFTERVVIVGPLVVDDVKVNPVPWSPGRAFITREIVRYGDVARTVADEVTALYIDVASPFIAAGGTVLLDDGVHPTTRGHEVVAATMYDALCENGWL